MELSGLIMRLKKKLFGMAGILLKHCCGKFGVREG